jgi:hypothetical protein
MRFPYGKLLIALCICTITLLSTGCGIYTTKDVSIDYSKVKTVRIGFIQNKASYINPQLSPRLTDNIQQKVVQFTKLKRVDTDDAHYQIDGYINGYNVTTSGVAGQQAVTNRLTVAVHITFKNTVENDTKEFDISRDFDFPATQSLNQAETQLLESIVRNLTDEIFNRVFSNW